MTEHGERAVENASDLGNTIEYFAALKRSPAAGSLNARRERFLLGVRK